jgi:hypothetical protein
MWAAAFCGDAEVLATVNCLHKDLAAETSCSRPTSYIKRDAMTTGTRCIMVTVLKNKERRQTTDINLNSYIF